MPATRQDEKLRGGQHGGRGYSEPSLLQLLPYSPFTVRPRSMEGERGQDPSLCIFVVDIMLVPREFPLHPLNGRCTHKEQGNRLSSWESWGILWVPTFCRCTKSTGLLKIRTEGFQAARGRHQARVTSWLWRVRSRTGTWWKAEALDFLFQQRDGKGDRGCA